MVPAVAGWPRLSPAAYAGRVLVGREPERERIDRLLQATRRRESNALVLAGEPGVGKTALLDWAADRAEDLRVVVVRAGRNEADLPYAALTQLLLSLADVTQRLSAEQQAPLRVLTRAGAGAYPDRFVCGIATLGLLTEAAADQPVLILVDDAHWMDTESASAIFFAMRRLRADPIVALMAAPDTAVDQVPGLADQPRLAVTGLSGEAVAALLAQECGKVPAASLVAAVRERTAGNAFAVREIARTLTPRQVAGLDLQLTPLPPPEAARRLFADRCRELGPEARLGLGLLALAEGSETGITVRAAAEIGLTVAEIERLEDRDLVSFEGATVHFAHPLLQWVAETQLNPAERRRIHAALADTMRPAPHLATRYAMHRAASVLGYDEQAAGQLEEVARQVAHTNGFAAATTILRHAAALTPPGSGRAARLWAASDMALVAGAGELSAALLAEARPQATEPLLRAQVAAILGQHQIFAGQPRQALRTLAGVQTAAVRDPPLAAQSLADAAIAAFFAGDLAATVALANRARTTVGTPAEPVGLLSDAIAGGALLHLGRVDTGLSLVGAASALVPRFAAKPDAAAYASFAGLSLMWAGEVKTAQQLIEPLVGDLRALQALGILPLVLYTAAHLDLYTGRLARGYVKASEAVDLADATANQLWRYMALGCMALAEALRGDDDSCRRHAETATGISDQLDLSYPRDIDDALGLLHLAAGNPGDAAKHLFQANQPDPADPTPVLGRPTGPDFVEAAMRAGLPVPGGVRAEIDHRLTAGGTHVLIADAWRCRGLLTPDPDGAAAAFRTAIRSYAALGLPLHEARTRLCLGETLRRAGARTSARTELRAAAGMFDELGAIPWAARSRRELRATGDTTVSTAGMPVPLTSQELSVAQVVARGATNKEAATELFLSTKTIEMHLSRAYGKLGVRSRTELANELNRRRLS